MVESVLFLAADELAAEVDALRLQVAHGAEGRAEHETDGHEAVDLGLRHHERGEQDADDGREERRDCEGEQGLRREHGVVSRGFLRV